MEKGSEEGSLDWMDTLISLRDELRSYKADNEKIVRAQENQTRVNAVILQRLSDL